MIQGKPFLVITNMPIVNGLVVKMSTILGLCKKIQIICKIMLNKCLS
jgi:hypothetical protein